MATTEIFEFRGVDNLVYAEVLKDTKDEIKFGQVKPLSPTAEIGRSTSTSAEPHYYDNKPMLVISSSGADELKLTVAPLNLPTYADITGQEYIENLGALIEGEQNNKYFAVGYRTKGTDGKYRYVWRYKGKFSIPDETSATENDGTDTNNTELTWTGVSTIYKFKKTGKSAKAMICDERLLVDYDYSRFFDYVQTPDGAQEGTTILPSKPIIYPTDTVEFEDSLIVTITCDTPGATILYSLTNSANPDGDKVAKKYTEPITITETTTVEAQTYVGGGVAESRSVTYTKKA